MERRYVDCREFPNSNCTVSLSADNDSELVEAAMQHATRTHGFKDTPEMRDQIRKSIKGGCCC